MSFLKQQFSNAATQNFLGDFDKGTVVENEAGFGARPAVGNDLKETAPAASPFTPSK